MSWTPSRRGQDKPRRDPHQRVQDRPHGAEEPSRRRPRWLLEALVLRRGNRKPITAGTKEMASHRKSRWSPVPAHQCGQVKSAEGANNSLDARHRLLAAVGTVDDGSPASPRLHCHGTRRASTGSRVPGAPRRGVPGGQDIGARLLRVRQGSNGHGRETHPSWNALGGFAPGERGRGLRRSAIRFGACPSRPPECPRWATLSQGTCRTRCTCSRTVGCSWLSRRSRAIIWRLALDEVGRCRNLG